MEDLTYIFTHVDVFLMVFCRILCFVVLLPIVEETGLPNMAKVGLSLCLSIVVLCTLSPDSVSYEPTMLQFTFIIVKECIVGFILGFGVKIFFQVYLFVGSLLSIQGGLSMSTVLDPTSATQSTIIGRLYNLTFMVLFILANGYEWLIKALIESFTTIPIKEALFTPYIVQTFVAAISEYFVISFKLAMPILGIILLVDVGMGVLARAVPQMNMFVVGIPIKIIILFLLMLISLSFLPLYNHLLTDRIVDLVNTLIQGMKPL